MIEAEPNFWYKVEGMTMREKFGVKIIERFLNLKGKRDTVYIKKADESLEYVGMSFRVSPKLKNLLMEIADGYGITITELLLMMTLKEAGIETLDET